MLDEAELLKRWEAGVEKMRERNAEKRKLKEIEKVKQKHERAERIAKNKAEREAWRAGAPARAEKKRKDNELKEQRRAQYAHMLDLLKKTTPVERATIDDVIGKLLNIKDNSIGGA